MNDVKISLTIVVPGAAMLSEQECSKQLKKPVMKGKKQSKDADGNPVFQYELVPDITKYDKNTIHINKKDTITFFTRKNSTAKRVLTLSTETYHAFISNEAPTDYHIKKPVWKHLGKKAKIEFHLNAIAESFGGKLDSYTVFND